MLELRLETRKVQAALGGSLGVLQALLFELANVGDANRLAERRKELVLALVDLGIELGDLLGTSVDLLLELLQGRHAARQLVVDDLELLLDLLHALLGQFLQGSATALASG